MNKFETGDLVFSIHAAHRRGMVVSVATYLEVVWVRWNGQHDIQPEDPGAIRHVNFIARLAELEAELVECRREHQRMFWTSVVLLVSLATTLGWIVYTAISEKERLDQVERRYDTAR